MAVYEISVEGEFHASHALPLPAGGPEEPHEHLWKVTATFRNDRLSGQMAVVIDFVAARAAIEKIAGELDGCDLNSMAAFAHGKPSAERVAEYLAERLLEVMSEADKLYRVSVTEAAGCSAAYYPGKP